MNHGQVKQLSNGFRIGLARAVQLVAQYVDANRRKDKEECRNLVPRLAESVRSFGVTFSKDVIAKGGEDDCAAAVALLLFGTPDVALPGGYSHVELSADSPIKQVCPIHPPPHLSLLFVFRSTGFTFHRNQVSSFPQELAQASALATDAMCESAAEPVPERSRVEEAPLDAATGTDALPSGPLAGMVL